MKEASSSRVCADLCWFFALYCFFSPAAPALRLLWIFAALCLLLGFGALRSEHAVVRLLWTLPALIPCAFAPDTATRVALAAGWLYFALTFAIGRFQMELWTYRRAFYIMSAAALFATLYVSAAKTFAIQVPGGVALFTAAFALLGLYTLRAIRMGVSTDLGWKAYSALELLLPAAAGGALFLLLRFLFWHAGAFFSILFTPFALLFRLITEFFSLLSRGEDMGEIGGPVTEAAPPETFEPAAPDAPPLGAAPPGEIFLPDPPPVPWGSVLAVLACVLALILFVIYLRQGRRAPGAAMERVTEDRFQVLRRRKRRPPPKDYAEAVRRCYAAYLFHLETHGQSIAGGDTSLDILSASDRPEEIQAAEQALRRLYLAARYGDGGSVSAADAEEAERCLEAIRQA
ncbi:MAG: hypothetical protein IJU66_03745 [Oscillospiraceae bacterium]|nr:hypothetical protein [Oscillospiraceae bacterium]